MKEQILYIQIPCSEELPKEEGYYKTDIFVRTAFIIEKDMGTNYS